MISITSKPAKKTKFDGVSNPSVIDKSIGIDGNNEHKKIPKAMMSQKNPSLIPSFCFFNDKITITNISNDVIPNTILKLSVICYLAILAIMIDKPTLIIYLTEFNARIDETPNSRSNIVTPTSLTV